MNAEQVNQWIQNWIDDHTDEGNPDDVLDPRMLRIGVVSILQFARDAGLIDMGQYQVGMNPIVRRTHLELGEEYLAPGGE